MAANTINYTFPIYNSDGTPFNDLVLRKVVVDSVVMSLGDKITGEVYYPTNSLIVTMQEYVEYKGVKYHLVSPPTILREGLVSDNSELKGMTKYSFTFYHPMYQLSNMPFTDVAVSADETKYLSQSGTFSWTGTGIDFIAKLNKNLQGTQWVVAPSDNQESLAKLHLMPDEIAPTKAGQEPNSNVLSFDNVMISDALKTCYDTWKVPFVIDQIKEGEAHYSEGKRYLVLFGLPSNEILDENDQPYIFRMGQGVGLKNNSRNPKNNKIITRIAGYGSTDNIQYGYPQIVWTGDQTWNYTINNDPTAANSYPIYDGYINGQPTRLIQHPFTRDVLMPSIYRDTVNKKVNPLAQGYNPNIEIKDYYDAPNNYPNPINLAAPSYQKQGFDGIKPRLQDQQGHDYGIVENAVPYEPSWSGYKTFAEWGSFVDTKIAQYRPQIGVISWAYDIWLGIRSATHTDDPTPARVEAGYWEKIAGSTTASVTITLSGHFFIVKLVSSWENASWRVLQPNESIDQAWDDTYDAEKDEYVQSYFTIKLPQLGRQVNGQWTGVDIYACASVTQEMKINMRSGACQGCTFPVEVDWEDYKKNFYKEVDGKVVFDPEIHTTDGDGHVRDGNKYPDSRKGQITLLLKKEIETFGTLMPNIYQQPKGESEEGANDGDKFVILGISLPQTYVTDAEALLDETMMQYMLENNVHYFDYPLKFDEHFLATHQDILAQMRNNTIVRFEYPRENGVENALYIKQMTVKYGDSPLPQYDITLTDDVEIILNQIGQVTDDVSRMRVQMNELQKYYGDEVIARINEKLSKVADDVAQGRITFQQGLDTIGDAFIHGTIGSPEYSNGLYTGKGWRIDNLGNAEMESLRVRSYLEIVELLVNRMQAQEGDTMFSDNDQIEKVDKIEDNGNVSYILSLKEKWNGYITAQMYGNVLKGIINTLAAQQSGISDVTTTDEYFTSWMQVVDTHNTDNTLGINQIRVVLYGDTDTPAGRNFVPCELMTIARWGNILNPDEQGITENEKKRRMALQSSFYISTSEGRIAKLTGVNKPKLESYNYGTTLGIVPDFVKSWSIANRLIDGRDYLYAQGVIVGDFIKVDIQGRPLVNYVDCGEWYDGGAQGAQPTVGHGIYLFEEKNNTNLQYETHEVWHNGALWRVKMHQPVVSGGVTTYYEPTDNNSAYWQKLMASGDSTRQIYSYSSSAPVVPQGYDQDDEYTPSGWSSTPLTLSQEHKDVYISTRKKHNGTWGQWSTPVLFSHLAEDGTSISITGSALKHYSTWAAFENDATKIVGKTYLVDENDSDEPQPCIVVWGSGEVDIANVGDAYIVQEDGQLYLAKDTTEPWQPLGQIKGDKGDDGKNTATVFIYKRSAGQPADTDKPTDTLTYSFTNGSLSGNLNGWSAIIPQSDGNPCWVRQVFVSSDSPTITIAPTSWSTANKYTEDGKDGVSFEAQYSPDMIQVHTTWQTGDLYMRTRATNASWSNWQRIVGENGENGDYTDYSFGISALLETASPTTSPSDISTWADAPIETTPQKPYLWSKVIKYIWVNGVKTADSTTYIRLTGEQGEQGEQGEDAVTYEVQVSQDKITIPSGETSTSTTMHFKFYSKEGSSTKSAFSTYWSLYKRNSDGTMELVLSIINKTVQLINYSLTATTSESAFVMYIWGNNRYAGNNPEWQSYLAKAEVVVLKNGDDGQDGARGKVGRFYYFAEEFNANDNDPTHALVVNDAQVPYFEHLVDGQKRYHVFNPETTPEGGSMTMYEMWEASGGGDWQQGSWNNAPWEVMTNDFKYLITEALFGKYANLGSFLINGDWLMSNLGTIAGYSNPTISYKVWRNGAWNNVSAPAYTFFDDSLPVYLVSDKILLWAITQPWIEGDEPYGTPKRLEDKIHYIECSIKYCKIYLKDSNNNMYLLADAGNGGNVLEVATFFKPPHEGDYTLVMEEYEGEDAEVVNSGGLYAAQFVPYIAISGSSGRIYHSGGSGSFYAKYLEMVKGTLGRFRITGEENLYYNSLLGPYDYNILSRDNFVQLTPNGQLVLLHRNNSEETQIGTSEALHVEGNSSFTYIDVGSITLNGRTLTFDSNGYVKAQ